MLHSATSQYTSLVVRYARLTNALALLGQRLSQASSVMLVSGTLPSADLIESLRSTREVFAQVRAEIFELARGAGIVPPKALDEVVSLRDLTDVLEGLEAAHATACAVSVLDRVVLLRHLDVDEFAGLAEAQARAVALKTTIGAVGLSAALPEVALLADGRHPFAQLLELVENGQSLDDERWRHLETSVADTFGRELAVTAARGKLRLLECGDVAPRGVVDGLRVAVPAGEVKVEAEEVLGLVIEHAWPVRTAALDGDPGVLADDDAHAFVELAIAGVAEAQADEPEIVQVQVDEAEIDQLQGDELQLDELQGVEPAAKTTFAGGARRVARAVTRVADLVVRSVLVVVFVAVAAVGTPLLFGWQFYAVDGGSMEPAIALGSVVAVQPVTLEELRVGDIITFPDRTQPDIRVTHRVVGVDARGGRQVVRTKGDANELEDAVTVEGDQFVGRVAWYLPYVGSLANSLTGQYSVFEFAVGVGVLLVSQLIGRGRRQEAQP